LGGEHQGDGGKALGICTSEIGLGHPNQLTIESRFGLNCQINLFCETHFIGIVSTSNDAGMIRIFAMQANEIATVERQYSAALSGCKGQNFGVWNALIGSTGGLNGEDVMAEFLKTAGGAVGKLFVGV
jgi:hypothetical protein